MHKSDSSVESQILTRQAKKYTFCEPMTAPYLIKIFNSCLLELAYPSWDKCYIFLLLLCILKKIAQIEVGPTVYDVDRIITRHRTICIFLQGVKYRGDICILGHPLGVGCWEILLHLSKQSPKSEVDKCIIKVWWDQESFQISFPEIQDNDVL